MATAEACHVAYDPGSYQCTMGSVGSLIEKQDFTGNMNCDLKNVKGCVQPKSFPKKGATQKELLSYLNFTRKDWKNMKKQPAVPRSSQRERIASDSENGYTSMHRRERRGTDFTKTSLPERGRYDKSRVDPSSFQPLGVNNFFSMQNLSPSGGPKLSQSYNSLNTPMHRGPLKATHLHPISLDEREEAADSLSDIAPQSHGPASGPTWAPLSTSTGHLNHIGGSLDRATRSTEKASCKSMVMLNRLHSAGEPPPYEYSCSVEDVVRKLEEQLQPQGEDARPRQRSPSSSEDPFAQVCEDKRRLWMEELEELKQMYVLKLQQVSQHSLRSQRILQLQLYKVQQEKKRLQDELLSLRAECEDLKQKQSQAGGRTLQTQESKSEDSRTEGEMPLLRQQLRDTQAELAQKVDEVFSLKTELRKAKASARDMDLGVFPGDSFRTLQHTSCDKEVATSTGEAFRSLQYPKSQAKEVSGPSTSFRVQQNSKGHTKDLISEEATEFSSCETDDSKYQGLQGECSAPARAWVERLQAALRLERRQSEELLGAFEAERRTWKQEKERVLKYQREIQTSYMEIYHRSQALEQELQDLRRQLPDHKVPNSLWIGKVESSDT